MSLCLDRRGKQVDSQNIDNSRVMLKFKLPLNEIAVDFYDSLKSITSGYASFDYEEIESQSSNIVKVRHIFSLALPIFKHCMVSRHFFLENENFKNQDIESKF